MAAAPQPPATSFPPAKQIKLRNGVLIVSQSAPDLPLVGVQVFLPAGISQQPADKAGIASIAASLVLQTPVEGKTTLAEAAAQAGGSVSYTLDPTDTRYYLECRDTDFPRLLHDLRSALGRPDVSGFAGAQGKAVAAVTALKKNPLETAYAMVREIRYAGTGFALPDQGSALTISRIAAKDIAAYADSYQRGSGTVVALEGAVSQTLVDAASREFGDFPLRMALPVPNASAVGRTHQIVAHRNVAAPWVAVAYEAPNQYSADFAAMLVIESLLGPGGDVNALTFASNEAAPDEYLGAYYQYEAHPGSMIVFLDGGSSNVDQAVRDLQTGIIRLRAQGLSSDLIDEGKRIAIGNYYLSINSLAEESWLLGRSAVSPDGVAFENLLPQRIASVSSADIQRVARRYLTKETVAIVLPQAPGQ